MKRLKSLAMDLKSSFSKSRHTYLEKEKRAPKYTFYKMVK